MSWNAATSSALLGLSNNLLEAVRVTEGPALAAESRLELLGHRTAVRALAVAPDDSMPLDGKLALKRKLGNTAYIQPIYCTIQPYIAYMWLRKTIYKAIYGLYRL